jgi:hypothetical protein
MPYCYDPWEAHAIKEEMVPQEFLAIYALLCEERRARTILVLRPHLEAIEAVFEKHGTQRAMFARWLLRANKRSYAPGGAGAKRSRAEFEHTARRV